MRNDDVSVRRASLECFCVSALGILGGSKTVELHFPKCTSVSPKPMYVHVGLGLGFRV